MFLLKVIPMILQVREKEIQLRKQLFALGLKTSERLPLPERKKSRSAREEDGDYECEICRANLFLSLVSLIYYSCVIVILVIIIESYHTKSNLFLFILLLGVKQFTFSNCMSLV